MRRLLATTHNSVASAGLPRAAPRERVRRRLQRRESASQALGAKLPPEGQVPCSSARRGVRGAVVEVVAVQAQPRLEAQRVACAQPDRLHLDRGAGWVVPGGWCGRVGWVGRRVARAAASTSGCASSVSHRPTTACLVAGERRAPRLRGGRRRAPGATASLQAVTALRAGGRGGRASGLSSGEASRRGQRTVHALACCSPAPGGTPISKPSSPVYPLRVTKHSMPLTVIVAADMNLHWSSGVGVSRCSTWWRWRQSWRWRWKQWRWRRWRRRRQAAVADLRRLGSLHRDQPVLGERLHRRVLAAAHEGVEVRRHVRQVLVLVPRVDHHVQVVARVGDDAVVDDAAVVVRDDAQRAHARGQVLPARDGWRAPLSPVGLHTGHAGRGRACKSAVHSFSMNSTRSAPRITTPSMCDTSKMPTASLRMPRRGHQLVAAGGQAGRHSHLV